jgi:hypothetical protein
MVRRGTQKENKMGYYRKSTRTLRPKSKYVLYYKNGTNGAVNGTINGEVEDESVMNETEETYRPAVSFNIPALIRVLELIREDVVSDEILHYVVEKIIEVGVDDVIDMDDYAEIASVVPMRLASRLR